MQQIGSEQPPAHGQPSGVQRTRGALWVTVIGMAVLVVIFAVALLQAANANSLLGWILAGIALGWLMLAVWALVMVRRAAAFGRRQVEEATEQLRSQYGRAPATTARAGEGTSLRDQKLAHGLQVIQVQTRVVREQLSAQDPDPEAVRRALETVDMTAANGLNLLRDSGGTVSGTVVD